MNPIEPVVESSIRLPPLSSDHFSPDGLVISDPVGLLADLGVSAPTIRRGGVHRAATGAVQDPAGSAVGQRGRPRGGGASGAIYAAFPDLSPIPDIPPGGAVFNASEGAGRRVLHTHSPRLSGQPTSSEARRAVLADLANAYANAIVAFTRRAADLGPDGTLLNLVPVSASIYAGAFASPHFGSPHLDPSYTITATLIAVAAVDERGASPLSGAFPSLELYYFAEDVYLAAQELTARLRDAAD